ncbi:MAG: methyltransferase family protein [Promethearchaeota archaeon]
MVSLKNRIKAKLSQGASIFLILPQVAVVIAPMLTLLIPLAYSSWYVFSLINAPIFHTFFSYNYLDIRFQSFVLLYIHGILVCFFAFSSTLFQFVYQKRKNNHQLIKYGIYSKIRHPQNLLIGIMMLLFSFIAGDIRDGGLSFGYLISWVLFSFFLQIESIYEERYLASQFHDEFWKYHSSTGFFFFPFPFPLKRRPDETNESDETDEAKYIKKQKTTYFRRKTIQICILHAFGMISIIILFNIFLRFYPDDFIHEYSKFISGGGSPPLHFINEIVGTILPLAIWLISFVITIVLAKKQDKDKKEEKFP